MGGRTVIGAAVLGLLAACADYDEATTGAGPMTTANTRPGDTDDDTDPGGKMDQPGAADGDGTSDAMTTGPSDGAGTTTDAPETGGDPMGDGSDGAPPPPPPMVDPNGPYGQCQDGFCSAQLSDCQWIPGEPGEVCSPWCGGGVNTGCPPVEGYETECVWEFGSCFIKCGAGCPAAMSCNVYGHCVWP